jgi:hypothetical protein
VKVYVTVAALPVRVQTALLRQVPTVAPEELINTADGAATVTFTAVYVPAATFTFEAIRFVSDCRRVSSYFADELGENTDTALPFEGVSVIPMIGSEKLTILVLVGGVSEIVKLSLELPPPPQFVVHLFFNPLQELKVTIAAMTTKRRDFFEFIQHPTACD